MDGKGGRRSKTKGGKGRKRLTSRKSSWGEYGTLAAAAASSATGPGASTSGASAAASSSVPTGLPPRAKSSSTSRQLSAVTASSAGSSGAGSSSSLDASLPRGSKDGDGDGIIDLTGSGSESGSGNFEDSTFVRVQKDVEEDSFFAEGGSDDASVISISASSDDAAPPPAASSSAVPPRKEPPSSSEKRPAAAAAKSANKKRPAPQSRPEDECDDDGDADAAPVRRSGRERKSTVIHVGGYAVRVDNNYVVRGDTYVHGAFDATAQREKPVAAATAKGKEPPAKKPRKERVISESERRRAEHNDAVKSRRSAKEGRRRAFLAKNAEVLAPFVEGRTAASLRTFAAENAEKVEEVVDDWADMDMQPDMIRGDMRDYQMIGLNWMARMHGMNLGMILGDEMGLGKTLQTISLLAHLKERRGVSGPSLVICPLSVLYSWCDELSKWAPSLNCLRFHSSSVEEREAQRRAFVQRATEYDVVVTTYEMAKSPSLTGLWRRQYFNYLVLDEGHKIKNHESLIARGVRHILCENRLILTGTPLQNNLVELWSLLNFLYPETFTVSAPFGEAFDIGNNAVDGETLRKARDLLDVFMLRRMKTEVEKLMPPKIETRVVCPLSTTQIFWYKALLMKDVRLLARAAERAEEANGKTTAAKPSLGPTARGQLNNLVMQLRKCCIHPFLFDGAEADIDGTTLEELIAASGKLAVLDRLLRSLFTKGHRVVLFSQFTSVLDILDDYCAMRGWRYCRFDGGTPRARRNFTVTRFNAPGSDCFLFLMSTRSGGMGLNLQTADTCVLFDSDWNPQPDIQAMARVHRIGQKKTVHVYRLVSGGTVEERIVERAEKKLYLDKMVNHGTDIGADGKVEGLSAAELLSSLKFGCNAVFGDASQNQLPTDDDIEVITDRTRTEDFSAGKLRGGATRTAGDFDANTELTSTTEFGGVDFKALRDEQRRKTVGKVPSNLRDVAVQWSRIQKEEKRQRKQRLLMVRGKGSGYGAAFVPVLASNNYELDEGESSVFRRELGGRGGEYGEKKKRTPLAGRDFRSQDFCQVCGAGGRDGAGRGKGDQGEGGQNEGSLGEGGQNEGGHGQGKAGQGEAIKGEGCQGEGSQNEGSQGEGGQGEGGQGEGSQGEGGQGKGSQGEGGQGENGQGEADQGEASQGEAGQGEAGQGEAGQGEAGQGKAGHGEAGQGEAGQGEACQGGAGQGEAGHGEAGQGEAGQDKAGQGKAGHGEAGQDVDGQNEAARGELGPLLRCPRCPVSLHAECAGVRSMNELMCCSHHRCSVCHKGWTAAGGILFPCQSCPLSYCEDCIPKKGVRLLERCERFEELGYDSANKFCYIHCSPTCEEWAKEKFGWSPAERSEPVCPKIIDVSHSFGRAISETALLENEEEKVQGRRSRRSRGR